MTVPRAVYEWWGSQGAVRERTVGPTTFYEVGYRARGGGFRIMGRAPSLEAAVEKARRRVDAARPERGPAPDGSLSRRHRTLKRRGCRGSRGRPKELRERAPRTTGPARATGAVHKNMSLRDALREAERQGWGRRAVKGTDEVLLMSPRDERWYRVKVTRKGTPQNLVAALRQGLPE